MLLCLELSGSTQLCVNQEDLDSAVSRFSDGRHLHLGSARRGVAWPLAVDEEFVKRYETFRAEITEYRYADIHCS